MSLRSQFLVGIASNIVSAALIWLIGVAFELFVDQPWLTAAAAMVVGVSVGPVLLFRGAPSHAQWWASAGSGVLVFGTGALLLEGWWRTAVIAVGVLFVLYRAFGAFILTKYPESRRDP